MRIQKKIAASGAASRREAEQMVLDGRVKVNGQIVYRPGHPVESDDVILIDDNPLPATERFVYYAVHKPKDTITARADDLERKSIFDLLSGIKERVEPIGRLDFNTTGLILLSNDGELTHALQHTLQNVPKRFHVKVWKTPNERKLNLLRKGVRLEDGVTKPAKIRIIETTDTSNVWLEVTITESRNRQIRRMFDHIGHPVSKLRRIGYATVSLGNLPNGHFRTLTGDEIRRLKDIAAGIEPQNAGKSSKYKKGYARPKPAKPKPGYKKNRNKKNKSKR